MIKHCKQCGKEFEARNGYIKLCNECKIKNAKERQSRNLERAFERSRELKLRSISMYADDIDMLKFIKGDKRTLADAFHVVLEYYKKGHELK